MNARTFRARMADAVRGFLEAGGKHPFVRVDGDVIEIYERPPSSTDLDKQARNQSRITEGLGGRRSGT